MIVRPFTFITGMMFVLSGAAMFAVKHESQILDDQLTAANQATEQDEQSIRVLQAQWALEADPSRLASLAAQFTGLQPMKPGQLVTLASLGSSLPPPGSAAPGDNPEDPMPAVTQLAAVAAAPAPVAAPAVQMAAAAPAAMPAATPAAKPVQMAAVKPRHHSSSAMRLASNAAPRLASTEGVLHHLSRAHAHIQHEDEGGSALYLADATPLPGAARSEPMGAQIMSVRAVAAPAPMPGDDGGSMLGMAQGSGLGGAN